MGIKIECQKKKKSSINLKEDKKGETESRSRPDKQKTDSKVVDVSSAL